LEQLKSSPKISELFKDGRNPIDDWYWETYGGNIGADIILSGSDSSPLALNDLSSKGGNLCVYINANGDIGHISTKKIKWREYLDDDEAIIRGGDVFSSAFLPKVVYKSSVYAKRKEAAAAFYLERQLFFSHEHRNLFHRRDRLKSF